MTRAPPQQRVRHIKVWKEQSLVNSKVARKFLQAAVKFRPVFRVSIEFCIPLDKS